MKIKRLNKMTEREWGKEREKMQEGGSEKERNKFEKEERREGGGKKIMMLWGSNFNPLRCLSNLIKWNVHLLRHRLIA